MYDRWWIWGIRLLLLVMLALLLWVCAIISPFVLAYIVEHPNKIAKVIFAGGVVGAVVSIFIFICYMMDGM